MMKLYRAWLRMLAHARRRVGGRRACPRYRHEAEPPAPRSRIAPIRKGYATLEDAD